MDITETAIPTAAVTLQEGAPFGADDPRMPFAHAVALGTAVIAAVRPDQLDDPTPCTEMDVRRLLRHLVSVVQRVAAIGEGHNPFEVPDEASGLADDAVLDAWTAGAHAIQRVWSDDAVLGRELQLPWTTMTGADALDIYTSEVTVHTWDLAVATGQRAEFREDVAERALVAYVAEMPGEGRAERFDAARAGMPAGMEGFADPFLAVVPVPDDAPAIDRLIGYSGRDPRWTPPAA